jgi:hypothetical protein
MESVRLSWVAHEAAMARLAPLKRRVVSTEKTRDAYKKQFNIGQRALLDLLDTENEVTDAQRAYWNADVNGQIAQYRVFTGIGRLLETLEIPPPTNARVSDQLVAMSERTSALIDTPTKPVIVAAETREMTDRSRPTLASGTETVGSTPVSIEHVAPYRAENGPRDKIQSAVTFHPPTRPSFASVRRTFPRSYDSPQAKLAMDLSLLQYQSPPDVPATTALMVAMQDPRVDPAVFFEGSPSASRATSLNLDLRLPAQETKSINLHLENLHSGGSQ